MCLLFTLADFPDATISGGRSSNAREVTLSLLRLMAISTPKKLFLGILKLRTPLPAFVSTQETKDTGLDHQFHFFLASIGGLAEIRSYGLGCLVS